MLVRMLVTPLGNICSKKKKKKGSNFHTQAHAHRRARDGRRDVLKMVKVNPHLSRMQPFIHPAVHFLLLSG